MSGVRVDFREFQLGDWQVRPAGNTISRGRLIRHLQPQSMNVLIYLAEHAGTVVSDEQLLDALWPGIHTGDDAVHRRIADLRKQLGDDARHPSYIRTIQKRGYELIAPVRREPDQKISDSPARTSKTRHLAIALFIATLIMLLAMLAAADAADDAGNSGPAEALCR